jgi:Protein of unknown function (DUF3341)
MTALLLAEFDSSSRLIEAARSAHGEKFRLVDVFSPFPVDGIHELLEHRRSHIRVAMFIGGIAMAALAYGTEYYSAVIDYPYNSGGRPFDAWPAFMLFPFATGILVAALTGFAIFLVECGLPRLHDHLFAIEGFERASQDRFIIALARPVDDAEARRATDFLRSHGATAIRGFDSGGSS